MDSSREIFTINFMGKMNKKGGKKKRKKNVKKKGECD